MTEIKLGEVTEVLRGYADNTFDAAFCDPPYGLSFMGKRWDYDVPSVAIWQEVLRALKPGAPLIAFGGTRTYHRMVVNVEDAGFEIRDQLGWLYGQGRPKGKATLKPALEPVALARKPLDGTMVANVAKWGVGGLAIDACRIGSEERDLIVSLGRPSKNCYGNGLGGGRTVGTTTQGRWPANLILDEDAAAMLDEQAGSNVSRFFYCPKATKRQRAGNTHPTVKPVALCEYLARLIMPPKPGMLLVPFAGSGSEMIGALRAGWPTVIGVEMEQAYVDIARKRLAEVA